MSKNRCSFEKKYFLSWKYSSENLNISYVLNNKEVTCFLALLYESTGRATALLPVLALALAWVSGVTQLTKMLKFYVKVFKTLYFLNPQMGLVYILYNYRCLFKILLSPIHTPAHNL